MMNDTEPTAAPPKAPPSRLTVVESVYFQPAEGEAVCADSRWSRAVATDEQPYVRRLDGKHKVGDEWECLDCGWVESASMLVVRNEAERFEAQPTAEQRTAAATRVVEVGIYHGDEDVVVPFAEILPGESCRFRPSDLRDLKLRCRSGAATVVVHLFPE